MGMFLVQSRKKTIDKHQWFEKNKLDLVLFNIKGFLFGCQVLHFGVCKATVPA